ncbi:MAG: LamG domain-containing protein [Chitinophagaceae bacterium]
MKKLKQISVLSLAALALASCQKMERPALGDYPKDTNPPNGPLKFYVAFDGNTTSTLRNAVDSIKANFPADNPFTVIDGVRGKAAAGVNKKYIKYASFNSWASSQSVSISVWFKQDGQTINNIGTNGPAHILSVKAVDNFHWSNSVALLFLEGNNTACAVKSLFVSNSGDNWFTWEGAQSIAGICDNNWHHLVLTYDQTSSEAKLYIDGVQNPNVRTWGTHGPLDLAISKISEYRVGAGPSTSYDSGDWLACSFKGGLDQLRLYSKVLSTAEIQALYTGKQ